MPRNAEVIRQWTLLQEIASARGAGLTIDQLASRGGVTTRTIRRDLQALEEAGFPLYDRRGDDGRTRWALNGQAFRGVAAGLTLSELCALYFSRAVVNALSPAPFRRDLERALDKLASALPPHMRRFLDDLPRVVASKPDPRRKGDGPAQDAAVSRLLEAMLHCRQASITYRSQSSGRTKLYLLHPYRLAHAQGGLYLLAYVPEYGAIRTFALERIGGVALLEERFKPQEALPDEAFPHSLGVHSGTPEPVEVEFEAAAADYVASRQWHPSQQVEPIGGGRVRVALEVCVDPPLQRWILGFGPLARVVAPARLVEAIARQLEEALARYPQRRGPDRSSP